MKRESALYHALLAAAFALSVGIAGYNAAAAPDFHFPVKQYQPYIQPDTADGGLRDTALGKSLAAQRARVNINTATAGELRSLPGIGEKTADAILEYRASHGSFSSRKDLMNVPGIGEKKYAELKDRILV